MFFTCLNALAAVWLFTTPLLWPELPARGVLAAVAGAAAVFLGVMGIASRQARLALVALGTGLCIANFFLPGGIGVTITLGREQASEELRECVGRQRDGFAHWTDSATRECR